MVGDGGSRRRGLREHVGTLTLGHHGELGVDAALAQRLDEVDQQQRVVLAPSVPA